MKKQTEDMSNHKKGKKRDNHSLSFECATSLKVWESIKPFIKDESLWQCSHFLPKVDRGIDMICFCRKFFGAPDGV